MTEPRKTSVKKEKTVIQEFEGQVKDIRQQFVEQLRCLESRTDVEVALLSEIQEYFKKRAEVELDYSRNLEKLAKQISSKHKAEKQKRESWQLFSLYSWWQQLINEAKTEARYRSVVADIYTHHASTKMASQADELQRISKRCREIGAAAHQEILRVLGELHTAMKTYQLCYAASCSAETKYRAIESQKTRFEESFPKKIGNRKHRILEREFDKKQSKYLEFKLKALKARNEYLLCIDAANAALHKYFADDLSDLIDCMDVGMEQWLRSLVSTILDARRNVVEIETKHVDASRSWLHDVDARSDKRRFLEANHSTFMLPRKFEFRPHVSDEMRQVTAQKSVQDELIQRYGQLQRRLRELKTENEEIWKTYATAERKLMEIQRLPELRTQELFNPPPSPPPHSTPSTSNAFGGSTTGTISTTIIGSNNSNNNNNNDPTTPRRNSCRESESAQQKRKMDLCEMEEYLLQKFNQYLLTCNLIHRLEARHDAIQSSLGIPPASGGSSTSIANGHDHGGIYGGYAVVRDDSWHSLASSAVTDHVGGEMTSSTVALLCSSTITQQSRPPSVAPKPRKKRVGQTAPIDKRPRLFGGSLEEYVEATGEEIPLIIRSCVRMLSLFGLHHQGVFRVSGSQIEINAFKDSFERGEDPLADVTDASDVNSVAGVLKLYFRELREPLFPIFMFDQFVDCTRCETKPEVVERIKDLVKTLSRPFFIVMRYLFAFLNHLSEFSDENMMDPYNLAICFGPTLLPIPESRDQVFFHNHVNELVRNMIVFHDDIFPKNDSLGGIVYEKYLLADSAAGDVTNDEDEGGEDETLGDLGRTGLSCSQEDLMAKSAAPSTWETAPMSAIAAAVASATMSAAAVVEPKGGVDETIMVRTHSDLNLSGHVSLKEADSPGQTLSDHSDRQYQAVWLRRIDSGRAKINGKPLPPSNDDHHSVSEMIKEKETRSASGQKSNFGQAPTIAVSTNENFSRRPGNGNGNGPRLKRLPSKSDECGTDLDKISDVSPGPSSCSNSPRDLGSNSNPSTGGGSSSSGNNSSATAAFLFKMPPPPTTAYTSNIRSYHTAPSGTGGGGGMALTAATISSSTAYARHHAMGGGAESPKTNRRDPVVGSVKRLSLSSYGIPISAVGDAHFDAVATSQLATTDEEYCYQYPDSDLIRPSVHHPQHQVPKGLSPTSLKEIQVELKAVLNSLETFTMQQQQTRINGSGTSLSKEAPFILSSPDALVVSSPVSPPDLVQNLPSPNGDAGSSPTSVAVVVGSISTTSSLSISESSSISNLASSTAERFAENKENTLKKGMPIQQQHQQQSSYYGSVRKQETTQPTQAAGRPKPPVPKKPAAAASTSKQYRPTTLASPTYRRRSTNDSSDEYAEDAML